MSTVARKHPRLPTHLAARVSGPSNDTRFSSEAMRVSGPAEDIKQKVTDHIKQYVIDQSFAHDDSTGSYMQMFATKVDPVNRHAGALGDDSRDADGNPASGLVDLSASPLSNSNVAGILAASGAWDSLSWTEKKLVCGCADPELTDLANAVMDDFGDRTWVNWSTFADKSHLSPLGEPPPPPEGQSAIFGTPGDYFGWHPPAGASGDPNGIAMQPGGDPNNGAPYWYVANTDAPAAEAPGTPKGGKFSGMHVADRFRGTSAPGAPREAVAVPQPPSHGISERKMEGIAFGVPTALGGLAAIRYGWMAFAAGGVVGVVAATGVYVWARVTAKKS